MVNTFGEATRAYYLWLQHYLVLDPKGLKRKRRKMMGEGEKQLRVFPFFRGTFYLWRSQFGEAGSMVGSAPKVLSAGDVHLENFGTWRDAEGRLIWGLNDFDEAVRLPFTSDLVRLAASFLLARRDDPAAVAAGEDEGLTAILQGYQAGLSDGRPFVLESRDLDPLRHAALWGQGGDPAHEWEKIRADGEEDTPKDSDLMQLLLTSLPQGSRNAAFRKVHKGVGSLGRQRWVVVAEWNGGPVAREAKATAPSAYRMDNGRPIGRVRDQRRLVVEARRAPDPGFLLTEHWVVRRLSPEMRKIELHDMLPPPLPRTAESTSEAAPSQRRGQLHLLRAMGGEVANLHAGTARDPADIVRWLRDREAEDGQWLIAAAREAEKRVLKAHKQFRSDPGVVAAIPSVRA